MESVLPGWFTQMGTSGMAYDWSASQPVAPSPAAVTTPAATSRGRRPARPSVLVAILLLSVRFLHLPQLRLELLGGHVAAAHAVQALLVGHQRGIDAAQRLLDR